MAASVEASNSLLLADDKAKRSTDCGAQPEVAPPPDPSFALTVSWVGALSYAFILWIACTSGVGDAELQKLHSKEVNPLTYQLPATAFITASVLNCLTVFFERNTNKYQMAVLALYINILAAASDVLSWMGYLPIVRDCFGHVMNLGRLIMWGHTTIAMVYLLSTISDMTRQQVSVAMTVNALSFLCGVSAHLTEDKAVSALMFSGVFAGFGYVQRAQWSMFDSALKEAWDESSQTSIKALRVLTMGLWCAFPVIFGVSFLGLLPIQTEEWLWTLGDVIGKVVFSSCLLHGNFMSIEQRRQLAMKIVQEGNRVQVIKELEEMVEQKEKFMSGITHELRTPLNGIIGLSDAILSGTSGQCDPQVTKNVTVIKTSGARLLNLINDILDAAAMRQLKGHFTIKQERVPLRRVAEDVVDLCTSLAHRGVKLVNNVSPSLPAVHGDYGRILQIMYNLLGNACKFTHTGTITVSAMYKVDEIEIAVSDTGIGIPEDKLDNIFGAFQQVDASTTKRYGGTGLGLNLAKQLVEAHGGVLSVKSKLNHGTTFYFTLKVWENPSTPDESLTPTTIVNSPVIHATTRSTRASLAGSLPIARSRTHSNLKESISSSQAGRSDDMASLASRSTVKRTASSLMLQPSKAPLTPRKKENSSSGSSSSQTIKVPQNGPTSADKAPPSPLTTDATAGGIFMPCTVGAKVDVLSVDDDPVNQMVIQNLLAPTGYTITQAMDGQEALEILQSRDELPDIILLDVMMPGMSGYEVCRRVRDLYPLSCVPIIMISAKSKEEDIVEGLSSGANDYVVKPFGRTEILARIATHLSFHEKTFHAGEMAAETTKLRGDKPAVLTELLTLPGCGTSLPSDPISLAAKTMIDASKPVYEFKQLTLVCWHITNLPDLCKMIASDTLAASLATFQSSVNEIMESLGLQAVDDPLQDYHAVLAGASGSNDKLTAAALEFTEALMEQAASVSLPGGNSLHVAAGIHTLSNAPGVVVGATYPVLHAVGPLLSHALKLMRAAEPACVLASGQVQAAAGLLGGRLSPVGGSGDVYVLKHGTAWQLEMNALVANCHGMEETDGVDDTAIAVPRIGPLRQALMALAMASPETLLDLGHVPRDESGSHEQGSQADKEALEKAAKTERMLRRQLDDVTEEASRLADEVDELTKQLNEAKAKVTTNKDEKLSARVKELETKLLEAQAELTLAKKQATEAEQSYQALLNVAARNNVLQAVNSEAGERRPLRRTSTCTTEDELATGTGSGYPTLALPRLLYPAAVSRPRSMIHSPNRLPVSFPAAAAHDIGVLLRELHMEDLIPRFQHEEVTPSLLAAMDDAALNELGVVSVGAKVKLRFAANTLFGGA